MTKNILNYTLAGLLMSGALLCIFTPQHYYFKSMSEYSVQIMFGYLILGLFFLLLKQPKFMFTSFFACSLLAIHLKINTDQDLKASSITIDEDVINIALINASNVSDDIEGSLDVMLNSDACIISISDIDPYVYEFFKDTLSEKYPYVTPRIGFDPGLAVFSKYEITNQDTFFVEDLPNIIGSIKAVGTGKPFYFISSNTLPPFYTRDYARLKKQLNRIAEKAKIINAPILTFADYNLVQWSDEIHDFRSKAGLKDSRRGFSPSSSTSLFGSFFDSPRDHIFFSEHLKCIGFKNLSSSSSSSHLGIIGSFQFNQIIL